MAVRTISAAGGNWNSTATWVGGVIPTTSDHIVGDATSGQLTVNVNATVQYHDFSAYTQTLTLNSGINLQFSLASATNVYGASMNYGGTGTIIYQSVASTIIQNNTNRIPNIQMAGNVTRTFPTNLYVTNFNYANSPVFNGGNTIFVGGSLIIVGGGTGIVELLQGTTSFTLDGSGIIGAGFANNVTITGNYNTYAAGVTLHNGSTLNYVTGTTPTHFNVILFKRNTLSDTVTLNCNQPIKLFLYNKGVSSAVSSFKNFTINLTSQLFPNLIGTLVESRLGTTDNVCPVYIFSGNSISATTLNLIPQLRTTSSSTNPPSGDFYDYEGPEIQLPTGFTHYIGSMQINGGTTTKPVIKSSSAGVKATLNLGSKITSQIINYDFTDINASGGQEIVAINGTISNSDNITNVYPTGGGGGGGSFTFVN